MDITLKEFVQMIITVVGGGLATYTAIRIDIASLKVRMHTLEGDVNKAHDRVDQILMERRK
jgi:uncharacterized protein (DUF697 family)